MDGNCSLQGVPALPRGGPNLGASSCWRRPGLCPSSGWVPQGWYVGTGGGGGLGSSERVEGHGGYCLASSVLKRVQVKGQGRPLAAACEQLQVCSAGLRGPDSPALWRLGLVLLLTSSEGKGEEGTLSPPQWTWFCSRPNATPWKREGVLLLQALVAHSVCSA